MSRIQPTGVLPINKSRSVPPPNAVMNEMTEAPKKSNYFFEANNQPLTAKTKVPARST